MSASPSPSGPKREVIAPRHESLAKEFDALGPQPREYGEARLWIVARDAHWIFAYWEFDPREHPEAVFGGAARFFIRVLRANGAVEITQEISPGACDLFIRVSMPEEEYSADLGFFTPEGAWCFIAQSGMTRTPAETGAELREPAADNGRGIRRLRALLSEEMRPGEPVSRAAERLRGKVAEHSAWTPEQEAMLVRLLAADTARMSAQKQGR